MQKLLVTAGIILLIAGIFWPYLGKIPFGRLPGDIIINRPNFKFYFPITTMAVISIIVSLIIHFFRK